MWNRLRDALDKDIVRGLAVGTGAGLLVLFAALSWRSPPATAKVAGPQSTPAIERRLELKGETVSPDALRLLHWVVASGDNGTAPFAVLDKSQAHLLVFDADGRLASASPVLLGYARGDDSVPGIGERPIAAVRPSERTTPAGRFVAQAGRNIDGEDVVWVDYDAAVSMHRVRLTNPAERRAERLRSPTVADNRISYGCINVPVPFFEQVLWPQLKTPGSVVYVLPEHKPLEIVFPGLRSAPDARTSSASLT